MFYLIENFIEQSNRSVNREELFALYLGCMEKIGFDSCVYTFFNDHKTARQQAGHGVLSNYPADWMQRYTEKGYQSIDPVVRLGISSNKAFSWNSIEEVMPLESNQKHFLEEAKEFGLKEGVAVPLHGPGGEFAGVGLASRNDGIDLNINLLTIIKLLTEQFHVIYCSLSEGEANDRRPQLTIKECEILKWLAIGKTVEDTAVIMQCTGHNVKYHLSNIYRKLDASSRVYAITKAIHLGYLPPKGN